MGNAQTIRSRKQPITWWTAFFCRPANVVRFHFQHKKIINHEMDHQSLEIYFSIQKAIVMFNNLLFLNISFRIENYWLWRKRFPKKINSNEKKPLCILRTNLQVLRDFPHLEIFIFSNCIFRDILFETTKVKTKNTCKSNFNVKIYFDTLSSFIHFVHFQVHY